MITKRNTFNIKVLQKKKTLKYYFNFMSNMSTVTCGKNNVLKVWKLIFKMSKNSSGYE